MIGQGLNTMDLTRGLGLQAGPKPIDINEILNRQGFQSADMTRGLGIQAEDQKPDMMQSLLGNPMLMTGLGLLGGGGDMSAILPMLLRQMGGK